MYCAYCNEKIRGRPIQQGNGVYCSFECAAMASGVEPGEIDGWPDTHMLEESYEDEDETTPGSNLQMF